MIILTFVAVVVSFLFALVPAVWFFENVRAYAPPAPYRPGVETRPVSVLIPARNEEDAIGTSVSAALQSVGVELEVVVLDDHSDDDTAQVVKALAHGDSRVRLVEAPSLPEGWCGKQHACWRLAQAARHPILVFLDADVRLVPEGLARMAGFLESTGADLASGIPRQETVGLLEKLLIPQVYFILLGFLPIYYMRRTRLPRFAAGCGQLFITTRTAYERSGGHAAIRTTLHDGIKLPRAYRAAGLQTDLFDATDLAVCRMYQSAGALWNGLAKNAGEALGSPGLIVPMSAVLLGGQVLPLALLGMGMASVGGPWPGWTLLLSAAAVAAAYYPRLAAVGQFRQSLLGALLHPVGIVLLVAIQWYAWACKQLGRPASWKGRMYPAQPLLVPADMERHIP